MCPYMIVKERGLPICEPKNILCTMCVIGNMKIFKEIEDEANKKSNRIERLPIRISMP